MSNLSDKLFFDDKPLEIPELVEEDVDFFGDKPRITDFLKKHKGLKVVSKSEKFAIVFDTDKMIATRVCSGGTMKVEQYAKDDIDKIKHWLSKQNVEASLFIYAPVICINKHGAEVLRGKKIVVQLDKKVAEKKSCIDTTSLNIYETKEEAERVLSNVCPKCFMVRINGTCDCES